jgi:prophage maintenance system killer protein
MIYLSPAEILYVHNRLIDEMGATHGVESIPVLKRTIKYIRNNESFPDKFSKAAALFFAIAKKKPFTSNNLATALFSTKLFLDLNKTDFEMERPEFQDFIMNCLPRATLEEIKNMLILNSRSEA